MRKILQGVGALVFLIGVSGAIDHLWYQPFFGFVLNSFNRFVIPNVSFVQEYALLANLAVGAALALGLEARAPGRRR